MQGIKQHLKKRETRSSKKSVRSGSPSSESSCSVMTKEDSCLLDDRWKRASTPGWAPPLTSPVFPPPFLPQAAQSRPPFISSAALRAPVLPPARTPPSETAGLQSDAEKKVGSSIFASAADPAVTPLRSVLFRCFFPSYFVFASWCWTETELRLCLRSSSPPPRSVRQRHKSATSLSKKKADKDKRSKVYRRLSLGK